MALTESNKIDKIEVVGDFKIIQVREANCVCRDGEEIAKSYHRTSYTPDTDVSTLPEEVQGVANAVWTDEVKAAYEASKQEETQ